MTDPRVSVGIATCDRPDALVRCLDALAAGALAPFEVLVVDQGSDPGTDDVVRARKKALPSLRRIAQPRLGLSASRNCALREAAGDVLAVTDDDCVPDAGWVEAISRTLSSAHDVGAVTGPMLALGSPVPGLVSVSSRTSAVRVDWVGRPAPWLVGTGANMAVRRALLEGVGGWDERLGVGTPGRAGEDLALIDRLLVAGTTIRYEPDAVVRHERRSPTARRATRWGYGHGAGAWCGLLMRSGDAHGGRAMLLRWVVLRARLAASAARRLEVGGVADEARVLAGTLRGVAYGVRLGGAG